MGKVTYENLFSESRTNVVNLISANVSDPIISSAESRKWIYSRIPDTKAADFKGYPFIVVGPTNIDIEKEETSGDGKHKFITFDISLEVMSSDRGYGVNDGLGLSQIDSISNSIIKTFLNVTNRNSLALNSMEFIEPDTGPVETINQNNELVYRRVITLMFRSRMALSA